MTDDKPADKSQNQETKLTVKLDDGTEKVYGVAEVKNLIAQQASATQKTQQVAEVLKICQKYGAKPEAFAKQADMAFERMSTWKDEGYLDDDWNIVTGKPQKSDKTNLSDLPGGNQSFSDNPADKDARSEALIAEATKPFEGKIAKLEGVVGQLLDMNLQKEVVSRYPDLTLQDARHALAMSRQDKTKGLDEHCSELARQKKSSQEATRKKYAEEFGVNLEEFDENKLNEQGADGGMLPMFKGKHFSLKAKRGDKDKMQPMDAAIAYIDAKARASVQ